MSIESVLGNPRLLRSERRRGKMCGSSKRDFETWDAGFTVSWQHPSRNVFDSPLHYETCWPGKKRREYTAMMKKRGRRRFPQKENRPLDRALILGAVLAPLACHLIGRTVACVEHIGKAIRKAAENNVVSTSAIVSR